MSEKSDRVHERRRELELELVLRCSSCGELTSVRAGPLEHVRLELVDRGWVLAVILSGENVPLQGRDHGHPAAAPVCGACASQAFTPDELEIARRENFGAPLLITRDRARDRSVH